MKHSNEIFNNKEIAIKIGDLYYDSLEEFLNDLSEKLNKDSKADFKRKRYKLSKSLKNASEHIKAAAKEISVAWDISKPYVKD